jgi:hypothetical protein
MPQNTEGDTMPQNTEGDTMPQDPLMGSEALRQLYREVDAEARAHASQEGIRLVSLRNELRDRKLGEFILRYYILYFKQYLRKV